MRTLIISDIHMGSPLFKSEQFLINLLDDKFDNVNERIINDAKEKKKDYHTLFNNYFLPSFNSDSIIRDNNY